MKVCITATGPSEDAGFDARFGRCQHFLFFNLEDGALEEVKNPNIEASGGAGIQSAQLVAAKGAGAVVTGHVGPNAYRTLSAAGIPVFTYPEAGTARDALSAYKTGGLTRADAADSSPKSGMAR